MKSNVDLFVQMSQVITGDNDIPKVLKTEYYDRLNAYYETELKGLIVKFKAKVAASSAATIEGKFKAEIFDPATKPELNLIKQIILIWFTGQFNTPDGRQLPPETEQQYKLQRMFPIIKAPVRAYSNHDPKAENKYGYWKNKP